jgi:rSAM-associated Gly-rich repeat protein
MSHLSRRQLLAGFLGGLAQAAGTVVLARAVLSESAAQGQEANTPSPSQASLQERADQVAAQQEPPDEEDLQPVSFVNGGFRNGGGGGFRKGGFANGGGGGGAFKKGGFANGGGGFRNGAFRNA